MRTELKTLEGSLVYLKGRATEARRDGTHLHLMLLRPSLHQWDGFSAVGQETPVKTDHLWVRLEADQWGSEMLQTVCGVGRVGYYRRADGTVDLGVKLVPCLDMDLLVSEAKSTLAEYSKRGLQALRDGAEDLLFALSVLRHQGKGFYAISRRYNSLEAAKILGHEFQLIQASINATDVALLSGKTKGHKPRGLDLPLRNCKRTAA
jgi:hypothetical protein